MVSVIINDKGIVGEFSTFLTKSDTSNDDEKVHPSPGNNKKESIEIVYDNSKQ